MNSALDKLYNDLYNEVDNEKPEEITDAERAKRFLAEKQVTIDKLKEVRVHTYQTSVPSVSTFGYRSDGSNITTP